MRRLMLAAAAIALAAGCVQEKPLRLEAENARLVGLSVATTQPSAGSPSQGQYVTGFDRNDDVLIFSPEVAPGMYDLQIGYRASTIKGFSLQVDGESRGGFFQKTGEKFAKHDAGYVSLARGQAINIGKGWGYFDIDYLELSRIREIPWPAKPPATCCDPAATSRTRVLMRYLADIYGAKMLSGAYGTRDADYVYEVCGKRPAILGGDLMEYSPSRRERGADPKGLVEEYVRRGLGGQIITMSWHWNAPSGLLDRMLEAPGGGQIDARWYKGFNTNATTFDLEKALAAPGSPEYQLLLRDIDVISLEMKKFAAADVPVLWRPLHEADGRWFWWGAKGSEAFKKLWMLMYERMTNHHGLHNLLWVYTGTPDVAWYPGDRYVDVYGIDAYTPPTDPLSESWVNLQKTFDGRKLLAISEYGGVPDPSLMWRYGSRWGYFVSWGGTIDSKRFPREKLAEHYRDPAVLSLEDLPNWKR